MKPAPVRSSLFNVLFYMLTAAACVVCLPTLFLPRRYFMGVVRIFVHKVHFLECFILGLEYEVRGQEHLPEDGSYIVAAKHQSAYETLKLHILFKDPAVILKKELLSIPLWGLYLKKSDPIAIDRSTPDAAIQSIQDGARRMKEQGRPIIIFPQGTRVGTDQSTKNKPYKVGIARIQEATDLPIIPMALNSGLFWPRNGWIKTPGRVIFEFLPPIAAGLERSELMAQLEDETEGAVQSLTNEAKEEGLDPKSSSKSIWVAGGIIFALLFGIYSYVWFAVAEHIQQEYPIAIQDITEAQVPVQKPRMYGYPGKIKLHVEQQVLHSDQGSVKVTDLRAAGWPIPYLPVSVKTGPIEIKNFKWLEPLKLDSLYGLLSIHKNILTLRDSVITQGDFTATIKGTADLEQEPIPALNLRIQLVNHQNLLQALAENGIIEKRMALFMGAGLTSLANADGVVEVPVSQKGNTLYAGPLPILTIPDKDRTSTRRSPPIPSPSPDSSRRDWDTLQAPSP